MGTSTSTRVTETNPIISVVVCTYDRSHLLKGCLASLCEQSLARHLYEVLVVDNASTDETPSVAAEYCDGHSHFSYLRAERLGLSVARNVGARNARGRYIAYIDDDAEADPAWLEFLLQGFEDATPRPDAVGGEIDPIWGRPPPTWMDEVFIRFLAAGLRWSDDPVFLAPPQWICEANCAYRSDILERYGPWPEDLGRKGTNLLSNENLINQRIFADGGHILFEPRARVRHNISAHRLTKKWMRRRHFWQGISEAVIVADHPEVDWPNRDPVGNWRPTSPTEWDALFDDARPDSEFRGTCHRIFMLGFLLQSAGLIHGR